MPDRNVYVRLTLLLTFLVAAFGGVLIVKTIRQRQVFLSTTSPKGSYVVSLTGRRDRPRMPLLSNEVYFSASKEGKEYLTKEFFHYGDWFDPSFDDLYPQQKWVEENVVQFYSDEFSSAGPRENIIVQNKTNKVIEYLRVTSIDSFLLFDLQPGSTITLATSGPPADSSWLTVEGEFTEGEKIKETGVGFSFPRGRKEPFTHFIYINEDGLTIESPGSVRYEGK